MRRIGILGGSFDPVHLGHLNMAQAAQTQLQLDEVWFVPAGHPWQKSRLPSAAIHRTAMLELAIHDRPTWRIEKIELTRLGPSYAIDTLEALSAAHPNTYFTWLIGADQLDNLTSWHEWRKLLSLCEFGVAPRPGYGSGALDQAATLEVEVVIPDPIRQWLHTHHHQPESRFHVLNLMPLACASSVIRANIGNGSLDASCLPPAVLHYLLTHSLYR